MRVSFLGLGVMGAPMAGHLARVGHTVTVYNRTRARAEAWVERHGGRFAATPAEAADGAEVVCVCVGRDDDVREVVLGPAGAVHGLAADAVLVDHTTASAALAREVAAAFPRSLDAPVSGGQAGAESGRLSVMVGGDPEVYAAAEPTLRAYAANVVHVGPTGAGQTCKMVNQICIAGVLLGLSEGLDFALRAGLDPDKTIAAISRGAAQSWQMENRWRSMCDERYDFGFAVDWMRKDLEICLRTAREVGARLPATALADQLYAQVQQRGGRRWDTSSLMDLYRKP